MRRIVLAALVSLALTPAAWAQGAQPQDQCKDADGKPIACPTPSKPEVTVKAPPHKPTPPPEGPTVKSPDSTIPPMATALCRDGSYSNATQPGASCAIHGGVAQWLH